MGKIYYWCPDYTSPVGGVRVMYGYVDILNGNGIQASILHRHRGFRYEWFENVTTISYIRNTALAYSDYLVIPENYASLYDSPTQRPSASRLFQKVFHTPAKRIFNQNSYNTFSGQSFEKNDLKSVYQDRNVIATLVISEDNSEYLRLSFPNLKIYRIHNSIHQGLFFYQGNKRNQICFMPRKYRNHTLQVINLLKFKGELNGFDIVPIEGKTEKETASIMREALIFLSFGYPEGFSLPPAKAMSCGCIVIGYHGMGGRKFFKTDFCFPVEMGDIIGFAKTVAAILQFYRENSQILRQMGLNVADYINKHYSVEQERKDIIDCWNAILGCSD